MNSKHLWIAVVSGAVLTTLVSNLPFVDLVNILCFAGFWGSAIFAVWLYRRMNGRLSLRQAVLIGLLTGVLAGLLGFGLSFLGLAGFQGTARELAQFLPAGEMPTDPGAPSAEILLFNLAGVLTNIFVGTFGGLLGGAFFRTTGKEQATTH